MKAKGNVVDDYNGIICSVINACEFKNYLELGLAGGHQFDKVSKNCPNLETMVAVDIRTSDWTIFNPLPTNPRMKIYNGTKTDDFFANNVKDHKFDVAFIDACHNYDQVMRDFNNVLNVIEEDGIIFMHDTYPPNQSHTTEGACSDAYKAYMDICDNYRKVCECVNVPIFCGLNIVRKINRSRRILTI